MNERSAAFALRRAQFAGALGVSVEDLETVGETFATLLGQIGIDGKLIFQRMSEGKTLASALSAPSGALEILYSRAHSWFSIGRIDKAEFLFRALCAMAGNVADYWIGYGICLKLEGRLAEAERAFAIGAEQRPGWAIPHFHLAETFLRSGDRDKARVELERFDACVDGDVPEFLLTQAERFRTALAFRSGTAGNAGLADQRGA